MAGQREGDRHAARRDRLAWLVLGLGGAFALVAPGVAPAETLPTIEVIGTTPLPGSGIDVDKVPGNVSTLSAADIARGGAASVSDSLLGQVGSINVNATMADPFQPDILYRGFAASPVLGTPQGLAVYQNGVRINEAFGDTVNWDLVPDIAVRRIDLLSANPVYGLNALGGAVIVTMKNGFTDPGGAVELAGGSFGRRSLDFDYGRHAGEFAAYVAARALDADGWRQFSPDSLRQLYADLGARNERLSLDLSFAGANNRLFGQGVAPVQELAAGRSLVFTSPQDNFNQLQFVALNATWQASDALSFEGALYRREFRQTVANGNTTNYAPCAPANGLLCQPDGTTPLTGSGGQTLPDISQGGALPIGEIDRLSIRAVGQGGTLQLTHRGDLFDLGNNFVAGASLDHAAIDFQSTTEIGVIDPALQVVPSGQYVATAETAGINATPVRLNAKSDYYGFYATDTLDLTPALAVTLSGRFNVAAIGLRDLAGTDLSGDSRYSRFNSAVGAAYKVNAGLTAYLGYAEGNRAPTPSEIECSNPAQPCLLPSALSSDPPRLKQVVSRTYETGLRGRFLGAGMLPGGFAWNLGLYRTDLQDDIYAVATSTSAGFFQNIGMTRRQGIEAGLRYKDARWDVFGAYSLVDATFRSALTIPSPNNPFADAAGNIAIRPGNHLPGIPRHRVKLGAEYRWSEDWSVGGGLTFLGAQYYRGDESNQNPQLPGYAVVSLYGSHRLAAGFELFAKVENLLNAHYAGFAQYGDPTGIGTPGIPAGAATNSPGVDNRFQSPGPPIAVFGGIRLKF